MNENSEEPKNDVSENEMKQNDIHEHDYHFVSSSNGDYNVCRGCGDVILVFSPSQRKY